jgi:hypothetical protein
MTDKGLPIYAIEHAVAFTERCLRKERRELQDPKLSVALAIPPFST